MLGSRRMMEYLMKEGNRVEQEDYINRWVG